jgi:PKHD-type hydroxylase
MKGEWCYFRGHFTPEQCNKILEDGLKLNSRKANLGVSGENSNDTIRRSDVRFLLKSDPTFDWLYDDVWKMAVSANNDWFNFHLSKVDYIQLAEYSDTIQGEYKRHHDVFWMNDDPFYHRKLTCVIQLTDPSTYEGGDLELFELNEYPNSQDMRTQGTAIFFPSFIPHAALPVTKGTRHSLAIWFDGPKWR